MHKNNILKLSIWLHIDLQEVFATFQCSLGLAAVVVN